MFAVIKTGGKQYKVKENDEIKIEKLDGEAGSEVFFNEVLSIGADQKTFIIGTPFIKGATVKAEIIDQARDRKIIIFKKKRRQNYRRKNGHRQDLTHVKIKEISKK